MDQIDLLDNEHPRVPYPIARKAGAQERWGREASEGAGNAQAGLWIERVAGSSGNGRPTCRAGRNRHIVLSVLEEPLKGEGAR